MFPSTTYAFSVDYTIFAVNLVFMTFAFAALRLTFVRSAAFLQRVRAALLASATASLVAYQIAVLRADHIGYGDDFSSFEAAEKPVDFTDAYAGFAATTLSAACAARTWPLRGVGAALAGAVVLFGALAALLRVIYSANRIPDDPAPIVFSCFESDVGGIAYVPLGFAAWLFDLLVFTTLCATYVWAGWRPAAAATAAVRDAWLLDVLVPNVAGLLISFPFSVVVILQVCTSHFTAMALYNLSYSGYMLTYAGFALVLLSICRAAAGISPAAVSDSSEGSTDPLLGGELEVNDTTLFLSGTQ